MPANTITTPHDDAIDSTLQIRDARLAVSRAARLARAALGVAQALDAYGLACRAAGLTRTAYRASQLAKGMRREAAARMGAPVSRR